MIKMIKIYTYKWPSTVPVYIQVVASTKSPFNIGIASSKISLIYLISLGATTLLIVSAVHL
jgi:hypothetical protein